MPQRTLKCSVRDQLRARRKTLDKATPKTVVDAQARVRELKAEVCKLTFEKGILKNGGVLCAGEVVQCDLIHDELVGG
jgi:transposase-like protein